MPAPLTSPEAVCNYALAQIGYKFRIADLFDGQPASQKCLDVYSQSRDAALRQFTWNFAQKEVLATASGGKAPFPFLISFAYPTDCIQVRNLKPVGYDANNPIPSLWAVGDDPTYGKVVWAYLPAATMVYTAQVTNPAAWEPLFLDMLAIKLGKKLKALVEMDANVMKLMEEVDIAESKLAAGTVG